MFRERKPLRRIFGIHDIRRCGQKPYAFRCSVGAFLCDTRLIGFTDRVRQHDDRQARVSDTAADNLPQRTK